MKKYYYLPILALLALVFSCEPVEETVIPFEEDAEGLEITLTWDIEGLTESETLQAADLDLAVYKLVGGQKISVDQSSFYSSFETVNILDSNSDGEYVVEVDAYSTLLRVDYTVTVTGMENGIIYHTSSSYFEGSDTMDIDYLTIEKSGRGYRVTDF